jgi:hypothetical protein
MRILKRAIRDKDVLRWQAFLNRIGSDPLIGLRLPFLRPDAIFGKNTQRATQLFQRRYRLTPDGVVGPRTLAAAFELGFIATEKPTTTTPSGPPPPPVQPPPPGPAFGNTRADSFRRLRSEGWKTDGRVQAGLIGAKAVLQSVEDGSGDYIYDEYRIRVDALPEGTTPEAFLLEMARDLNGTVNNLIFDGINKFRRQVGGDPTVGEVIPIDILGPDDGAVILAELRSNYFIFQTIDSDIMGSHPENGSREFGFEAQGNVILFYTRGVSRPGSIIIRIAGSIPQSVGWTQLCYGIAEQITRRGGRSTRDSLQQFKESRGN